MCDPHRDADIKRPYGRETAAAIGAVCALAVFCGATRSPGSVGFSPVQQHAMRAAVDAQLASGDGRLCIPGPDAFPAVIESDDVDASLSGDVARLVSIGFIRVIDRRTGADGVSATSYDLTNAGRRLFSTYRRRGNSDEEHGWCFAQFRAARIVATDAGSGCPPSFRPDPGALHARASDPCTVTVTYLPQVYNVAAWAAEPQAQAFPDIAELSQFPQTEQTMTLELVGDAADDAWQPVPGQYPSSDTP